jgi:hypothetical protein
VAIEGFVGKAKRDVQVLLDEAARELAHAVVLHAPMHSAHEGYAVILEELDELKLEVWKKHPDVAALRKEAIQIAAMGLRFVIDVCDRGRA